MSAASRAAGALTLLLLIGAGTAAAQTAKPAAGGAAARASSATVVLTPLFAPPGDSSAAKIAAAATSALSLVLHLTGSFTVVEAPDLDPIMNFRQSIAYYRNHGARIGMFGTVTPGSSSSYIITVQYWQSPHPTARPATFSRTVSSVSGAVQAAEELAVKVAAAAANRKLEAGTVEVKNLASLPSYSVYADGQLVARNESRVHLLAGKRTVTVEVPGGASGDRPLQSFQVDVKAGRTVTVTLKTPAGGSSGEKRAPASASRSPTPSPGRPGHRPETGALQVITTPDGAAAFLDGRRVGTTPLALTGLAPGIYHVRVLHRYFKPALRSVTVAAGSRERVALKLTVNRSDPAVEGRLPHPLGIATSSLMWSAAQTLHFFAIAHAVGNARGLTSSFLTSAPAVVGSNQFPLGVLLDIDFDLAIGRIGSRLLGSRPLTVINDVFSTAAAAAVTSSLILPALTGASPTQNPYGNADAALVQVAGTMAFDLLSSTIAASNARRRVLDYLSTNGTLPPSRPVPSIRPHQIIVESGGDSVVRLGFREPFIRNYLAFEESVGLGAKTLQPFAPALTAGAVVSYNPWGSSTGRLRPELFVGLRAFTGFTSTTSSIEAQFGTGNDWIGKHFDLFARGGLGYDLTDKHWDQFFTIGTRLF